MKQLLFFFAVLLTVHATAQDDQWLVKNGLNSNGVQVNSQSYMGGVLHPTSPLPQGPIPRNDIFVIASGGTTYFNSRYYSDSDWNDHNFPGKNYILSAGLNIGHLYLTNLYESDDPDARVVNTPPPSSSPLAALPYPSQATSPPYSGMSSAGISANHDIVKEKDITLILNIKTLREKMGGCDSFKICFDKFTDGTSAVGGSNTLLLSSTSGVFNGDYTMGLNVGGSLVNNCIDNIQITSASYGFINLKVPQLIHSSLVGKELSFVATSTCSNAILDVHQEEVRDSHDPNYVKVECVRSKPNFVYYRIHCFNESSSQAVNNLQLSFVPPAGAISVSPMKAIIGGTDVASPDIIYTAPSNITDQHKFGFPPGAALQPFNTVNFETCSADLYLCVKMDSDLDMTTVNLQPSIPFTYFDSSTYAIHDFYDECQTPIFEVQEANKVEKGKDKAKKEKDRQSYYYELMGVDLEEGCARTESSYCDCKCGPSECKWYKPWCCNKIQWPQGIGFAVLGFFLLTFLFRSLQKSK